MTWAFIIPYRDRAAHLEAFVAHYRPHFPSVPIYVVEQADSKPFNRAKLLNIGWLEAGRAYDYVAFHDVDMLATNADYGYPETPTCLAMECSQFGYKMPYPGYFGGVTLVTGQHFDKIGGFSNEFWSWGGEDDRFYNDVIAAGLNPAWRKGRYECFDHPRPKDAVLHAANAARVRGPRAENDNLDGCKYKMLSREKQDGYTLIRVEL